MIYKGFSIEKSPYKTIDGKELWRVELRDLKTAKLLAVDACPHFRTANAAYGFVNWLYEMRRILYSPNPKEGRTNGQDDSTASLI